MAPDKNDVGLANMLVDIRTEEEVTAAASPDHLLQAWLVDRQLVAHPGSNPAEGREVPASVMPQQE